MDKETIRDRKNELVHMLRERQLSTVDGLAQLRDLYANNRERGGVVTELEHRPERLLYRTEWAEKPLPSGSAALPSAGIILIMDTDRSLWTSLQELVGTANQQVRVLLVMPGPSFRQTDDYTFELHPSAETDYRELMRELQRQGCLPHYVINRWSREHDDSSIEQLLADGELVAQQADSLTWLIRSMMEHKVRHDVKVQYVFTVQPGEVRPMDGAVSAFGRSLYRENSLYRLKQVQVETEAHHSSAVAAQLAAIVCMESGAAAMNDPEVCYRSGQRLVPAWTPIRSEEMLPDTTLAKPGGVYLITGGMGGAGYATARSWASSASITVVLAGRSERTDAMEHKLEALKQLGSEAVYMRADTSHKDEAEGLIRRIRSQFGRIDGIVHCAGVHYDGYVYSKSAGDTRRTFDPKLAGAVNLDEASRAESLQFFILFSSMAARFGNAGQSDYAYANRIMDLYAEHRNAQVNAGQRHGVTISVNWTHWAAGGMKVPEQAAEALRAEAGLLPLPEEEAVQLLASAVMSRATVCFAGLGDRQTFERFVEQTSAWPAAEQASRATESGLAVRDDYESGGSSREWLYSRTEALLKQVFEEALKLPPSVIRPNRTFQEYGVDSIMVEQFNQRMERYAIHLPKTLLFEYQTITELTGYMLERHTPVMTALFASERQAQPGEREARLNPTAVQAAVTSTPPAPAPAAEVAAAAEPSKTGSVRSGDIAIIGMSGRFPGADTPAQFWDNLVSGRDSITEVPAERWDTKRYYDPDPDNATLGKMYCTSGGFLRGVDQFDYSFFSISPREAATMDPQERLFLTLCWETMEDAGYVRPMKQFGTAPDNKIGVFAGVTTNTYALLGPEQWMQGNIVIPNSMPWSIANRVSYHCNFTGPSMPVDTACASGLTAIHLAAESIQKGECSMALAGGVNMYLHPSRYVGMCAMRMLSKNGRCSTFGADADGFVPGEGAGVVLLKPLEQAIADGDSIYGVIKGTAVNHGGATSGYTVPNPNAQAALIQDALDKAQLDPRTISYVEAHGTGTSLGDPIEITGLAKAYGTYTDDVQYCAIGSVKSNIGHLESAAGIAGLIKVLLQMKHKQLVPSLHASRLNPKIDFERSPFYVQQQASAWEQPIIRIGDDSVRCPRRAGISSFGAGGANAHIIVEEYEPVNSMADEQDEEWDNERDNESQGAMLFLLSARNEERLQAYAQKLLAYVEDTFGSVESSSSAMAELEAWLPHAAYTSQIGREPMKARAALLFDSGSEWVKSLQAICNGDVERHAICTGNTDRAAAEHEQQKEAGDFDVQQLMSKQDWQRLARLWADGLDIDWKQMNRQSRNRRVPMPTYPFAAERCWIRLADSHAGNVHAGPHKPLHALIDQNLSTFSAHKFAKHFSGKEFYLEDHLQMLPAVVYMEMARAAGELASDSGKVTKLRNVVFASPIVAGESGVEAETLLDPRDEYTADFEIRTRSGSDRDKTSHTYAHAQGTVVFGEYVDVQAPSSIDIEAVLQRCEGGEQAAEQYYRHLASIGAPFGPRFQGIGSLHWNSDEALTVIRMPEGLDGEQGKYTLHPTVADAGLQTVIAWAYRTTADPARIYLPFVIGELVLLDPSLQPAYVYARRQDGSGRAVEEAIFEVLLLDEQGRTAAMVRNYSVRPFQPVQTLPSETTQQAELLYYRPEWLDEEMTESECPNDWRVAVMLLFDDREELAASLTVRPELRHATLIRVEAGTRCGWSSDRVYQLQPGNGEHYMELFGQIKERFGSFSRERELAIVHAWSCLAEAADAEARMIERGIASVFHLTKACMQRGMEASLLFVHGSNECEAQPVYAAVSGFAGSVVKEYEGLRIGTLGLIGPGSNSERNAALITAELAQIRESTEACEVRYAGQVRQVRRLTREYVDETPVVFQERGVYIVTGGAGGLGLLFAEYLARRSAARLVLVGRSELRDSLKERLEAIRMLGGQVQYLQADISMPGEAERIVRETRAAFGPINGVLHCAGNVRDGLLMNKSWQHMEDVLKPKVAGLIRLGDALKEEKLDWFALFSSLSAFGNAGQSDYAYANSFLDYYAARFARETRFGKLMSVNWPYWEAGGMQLDGQAIAALEQRHGFRPLEAEAGLQAFTRLLSQPGHQYAVVNGDAERVHAAFAPERTAKREQPVMAAAIDEPVSSSGSGPDSSALFRADLVKLISTILQLRPSEIQMNSSMSDFGFDSITFTELSNKLNRTYGLDLTPAVFFAHETPEASAAQIYAVYGSRLDEYYKKTAELALPVQSRGTRPESRTITAALAGDVKASVKEASTAALSHKELPHNKAGERHAEQPSATMTHSEPVAIVGASGLFPQSDDIGEFWNHLAGGSNLVTEIPPDRWDWRLYYGDPKKQPHKTDIIWGAFMNDPASFDPLFFGISPREAERLDPQARKVMETVYRTIEDAGYKPSDLSGTRTGLFMGVSNADYSELLVLQGHESIATQSMLVNRISFLLNLRGPSEPIDTACSSSLVAIHRAVEAIRHGGCEMAIAGGVNMMFSPNLYIYESQSGMLSPDGACKTFDAAANGYVRGEGVGAVLLKPLSRAMADGDHIYAVIRGSAVNHGGRASSVTAPNSAAQADLIVEAYSRSGIDPATVTYIETHGTGTSLGDPVEIEGLKLAFDRLYRQAGHREPVLAHCGLGSVKTNIGHLESASGIAGFIKVLLAMKHRMLPGLIHYSQQNPYIRLDGSPFYLVTEPTAWKPLTDEAGQPIPLRAGISSFGIGGVNAHIVVEQAEMQEYAGRTQAAAPVPPESHSLFILSARNKERLADYARQLHKQLLKSVPADGQTSGGMVEHGLINIGRDADSRIAAVLLQEAASVLQVEPPCIDPHAEYAEIGFDPISLESFLVRAASRLDTESDESASGCRTLSELAQYWASEHHSVHASSMETRPFMQQSAELESESESESVWLANAAYTLQVGREAMAERAAFLVRSKAELADMLLRFAEGETSRSGMITGSVQSGKEKLEWLTMLSPAGSLSDRLIGEGDLEALAKLWTNGMAIDWTRLYAGRTMKRVPLPGYPFAKDKYWMEADPGRVRESASPGASKLHPLLTYNSSTLRETSYTAWLDSDRYYLKDHLVGGQPLLPGAVYVELAKAAAELAGEGRVSRMENLVWVRPLVGTKEPQSIKVALQPEGNGASFSVTGTGESGADTVYAQGRLHFGTAQESERLTIDVAAVQARCETYSGSDAFYEKMRAIGITFGPSFRSLEWIRTGGQEALARIRLPESMRAEAGQYGIHPVVLDGALQTVTGLLQAAGADSQSRYFPFSVRAIQQWSALPAECFVYAVITNTAAEASREADYLTFDLWITDTSGIVVASLLHYLVKRSGVQMNPAAAPKLGMVYAASATAEPDQGSVLDILRKLHAGELDWEQADRWIGGAV